jgi:hypothetical protein
MLALYHQDLTLEYIPRVLWCVVLTTQSTVHHSLPRQGLQQLPDPRHYNNSPQLKHYNIITLKLTKGIKMRHYASY